MSGKTEYVEVDLETVFVTHKAVLLSDGDVKVWVPKSVMTDWPGVGETGTVVIARWCAEKHGLI